MLSPFARFRKAATEIASRLHKSVKTNLQKTKDLINARKPIQVLFGLVAAGMLCSVISMGAPSTALAESAAPPPAKTMTIQAETGSATIVKSAEKSAEEQVGKKKTGKKTRKGLKKHKRARWKNAHHKKRATAHIAIKPVKTNSSVDTLKADSTNLVTPTKKQEVKTAERKTQKPATEQAVPAVAHEAARQATTPAARGWFSHLRKVSVNKQLVIGKNGYDLNIFLGYPFSTGTAYIGAGRSGKQSIVNGIINAVRGPAITGGTIKDTLTTTCRYVNAGFNSNLHHFSINEKLFGTYNGCLWLGKEHLLNTARSKTHTVSPRGISFDDRIDLDPRDLFLVQVGLGGRFGLHLNEEKLSIMLTGVAQAGSRENSVEMGAYCVVGNPAAVPLHGLPHTAPTKGSRYAFFGGLLNKWRALDVTKANAAGEKGLSQTAVIGAVCQIPHTTWSLSAAFLKGLTPEGKIHPDRFGNKVRPNGQLTPGEARFCLWLQCAF